MSDQNITLSLQKREVLGKGVNKLRRNGLVPAVIHDHGNPSKHVMAEYLKLEKVYSEAGKHHTVELELDGKKDTAIIKDVSYDPVKNRVQHVVFQSVRQNEVIETEVPVVLEGEIPAEKSGLMVIVGMTHVEVEALPKNLPDELHVDARILNEIGDKITVADIIAPEGVTITTDPDHVIAAVEETKAQISEETPEELDTEAGAQESKTSDSSEEE